MKKIWNGLLLTISNEYIRPNFFFMHGLKSAILGLDISSPIKKQQKTENRKKRKRPHLGFSAPTGPETFHSPAKRKNVSKWKGRMTKEFSEKSLKGFWSEFVFCVTFFKRHKMYFRNEHQFENVGCWCR